ncbi:MAG: PA14 domain-containing protein [Caldilineaceae bacterium]|nr:PA14 domain-containing protein [Caldilineaceae bacterium]
MRVLPWLGMLTAMGVVLLAHLYLRAPRMQVVEPASADAGPIFFAATDTPTPTPTSIFEGYSGWRGEYFDNPNLSGSPVLVRDDANLDFNWRRESPGTGVPVDSFSVRWQRIVTFDDDHIYRFRLLKNDGARVWFDGRLLFDLWNDDDDGRTYDVEVPVKAGEHTFRVEYREDDLDARVRFWWERRGAYPTATHTPTATPTSVPPLEEFNGWRGEYFNNLNLEGEPVLVRDDADINFNWEKGSPAPGIGSDNFTVRWERIVSFDAGFYRFNVQKDDGARVWIGDRLIIDEWRGDNGSSPRSSDVSLDTGDHTIRVEYFEGGHHARIRFWWESLPSPIATPTPTPTPTATATRTLEEYSDWRVEGFANQDLVGAPFRIWSDGSLDENYRGNGTHGLPKDHFSLRWERIVTFDGGLYRFFVEKDDGARVWVDGELIIDHWKDCCEEGIRFEADLPLIAGDHTIRVEYYEKEGDARVKLWWERSPLPPPTPLPARPSIWAATMTVGSGGGLGGYGADTDGTLSDNDFTLRGKTYTVDAILHNPFADSVSIEFSDDVDTDSQELTLCLDTVQLDFADAFGPDARQFFWDDVDTGWSDGGSVSVGLNGCQ